MSQFESRRTPLQNTAVQNTAERSSARDDVQKSVEQSIQAKMPERKNDGVGEVSARSVAQVMQELVGAGAGFKASVQNESARVRTAPITVTDRLRQGLPAESETPTERDARQNRNDADRKERSAEQKLRDLERRPDQPRDPQLSRDRQENVVRRPIELSRDGAARGDRDQPRNPGRDVADLRISPTGDRNLLRDAAMQIVSSYSSLERLSNEAQLRQLRESQLEASRSNVRDLQRQVEQQRLERFAIQRLQEGRVVESGGGLRLEIAEAKSKPDSGKEQPRTDATRLDGAKAELGKLFSPVAETLKPGLFGESTFTSKNDQVRASDLLLSQNRLSQERLEQQQRRQREETVARENSSREERRAHEQERQSKRAARSHLKEKIVSRFGGRGISVKSPAKKLRGYGVSGILGNFVKQSSWLLLAALGLGAIAYLRSIGVL